MIILRQKQYMEYSEIWKSEKPAARNRSLFKKLQLTCKKATRDAAVSIMTDNPKELTNVDKKKIVKSPMRVLADGAWNKTKAAGEHVAKNPVGTVTGIAGDFVEGALKHPIRGVAKGAMPGGSVPIVSKSVDKIIDTVEKIPVAGKVIEGVDKGGDKVADFIGEQLSKKTGKTNHAEIIGDGIRDFGKTVDDKGKSTIKKIGKGIKKIFKK